MNCHSPMPSNIVILRSEATRRIQTPQLGSCVVWTLRLRAGRRGRGTQGDGKGNRTWQGCLSCRPPVTRTL